MEYFADLKAQLLQVGAPYNFEKIESAYLYAKDMHQGQYRKSGEEYITHPVAVATIVAQLELDTDAVCAALLHDTVEDCKDKTDISVIKQKFGEDVADLVDGLTKLTDMPFEDREEESIENLRKMFLAMSKDIRVIFIKLSDRLHNMRTLDARSEGKQRSIALETMHVYAPLAHRLGIQKIKAELENLALKYLDPIGYEEVERYIEDRLLEKKDFLELAQNKVSEKLNEVGIKFSLEGRVKSIYSIYKKMFNQNKSFDEIYDFYAIRVLVDTELECYTVLGIIHEMFSLIPGRFKDYISTPKPNMYRSLHTSVMGKYGIPFEVQIRTWDMHTVAEYGLAAHWKYKSGEVDKENLAEKLRWIRTLIETEKGMGDADEFLRPLKIDIFEDETFVFTPKGDVINLPSGSTAIDFAYAIHSAVGNKMVGAKVNGNIVNIDTQLQTGQIVEVITSASSKGPSKDWLKIVRTSEAKNKIRQWFKKEKRSENIIEGKNTIEREFKRYGRTYTDEQKNEVVANVSKRIGMADVDDFYNNIGFGGITLTKIASKLKDEFDRVVKPEIDEEQQKLIDAQNAEKALAAEAQRRKEKQHGEMQSVIVDSIDNCQVRFAKCCNPLPGDSIIGFVTRGFGVSVHKYNCENAIAGLKDPNEKDRWVSVRWAEHIVNAENSKGFDTILQVFSVNSILIIAKISELLNDMRIPLHALNTKESGNDGLIVTLTISCRNTQHVDTIIARMKKIDGVKDITRGIS